jgi:hypothetical protein
MNKDHVFDQKELMRLVKKPTHYEEIFPIWQCPECGWLNQFLNTFRETCDNCEEDHTLDWNDYIVSETK